MKEGGLHLQFPTLCYTFLQFCCVGPDEEHESRPCCSGSVVEFGGRDRRTLGCGGGNTKVLVRSIARFSRRVGVSVAW